ncbi:globin domain-containing protein [Pseudonocardia sp.]|jgi:hemoglobin-like flavoprotein|uniref:globin domain-containing protein n=1 Tax=Pseudonocardia sp. TaxID=60912 RepID=UPI002636C705|nr:globin domain-containing protein [Pseudonocardia sp.]MCW2719404.1 globin family protein [Pseudonocardia sp.]MDT7617079.1 hypothetical protein [Pseudonocardiales bacterium]
MTRPDPAARQDVRRPAPEVIAAVRASCASVADRPVRLAETFYAHLFEMAPHTRGMFPADMSDQMQKMTGTLLAAISHLESPDTAALEALLRKLGADHRTKYGVESEHYLYIGHALTRAVRDVSGPAFSGGLSSSWIAVYQWVAAHMMAGADVVDAAPVVELPQQREPDEHLPHGVWAAAGG